MGLTIALTWIGTIVCGVGLGLLIAYLGGEL
jgi:hypothetical protein